MVNPGVCKVGIATTVLQKAKSSILVLQKAEL
jgi:hypothetical protein